MCNLRLCITLEFFLDFSSRDFEETSDGELLVASKYEPIIGMGIEKSYAGVPNSYLSINIFCFSHGFLYLKGSCPEPENPPLPARKRWGICPSLSPFQENLPSQSLSQDRLIQYFISLDFSLIEGNEFVLEFGFGFVLLCFVFLVEKPSFK